MKHPLNPRLRFSNHSQASSISPLEIRYRSDSSIEAVGWRSSLKRMLSEH